MGFDSSCKLSPVETVCMKCQILFSEKNKKNIISLLSAEFAPRVVKVKPILKEFPVHFVMDTLLH